MISKRNPILDADVWLNGGTPWLSHTLHHASILLGLDVNVATIQKIEGQETLFFNFTNPLKTQKLATQLNSLHGPRTLILKLLKMLPLQKAFVGDLNRLTMLVMYML